MATTRKTTTARTSSTTTRCTTKAASTTKKAAPKKTTTATPRARKTTAPKAKPTVVTAAEPVVTGPVMRKKELIDAVVAKSGMKKRDVKPIVETMLDVLGDALRDGRELNVQPLGKIMVRRSKKLQGGSVLTTKVRLKDRDDTGDKPAMIKAAE